MSDGSPTVVDKLTELSRTHHAQQLEELLHAIIKDLPAGSLNSKSRRAVCKAVQLKPQGLRLRLRSLASGKTENEVMPALPGSLLGARIARLPLWSLAPCEKSPRTKDEIFTTLSLLMSEDLVASPSSDNIMTNIIRLRTVARSATGDGAIRALQRPIRELLLHEEVVVDMAMYDSCKLLAYVDAPGLSSWPPIDDSTLSDRIRITLCSILLSKAAAAAQLEFENSRIGEALQDCLSRQNAAQLRLLHWPPADERLFTSGSDAISRQLFDEESDCGGSGAWRVRNSLPFVMARCASGGDRVQSSPLLTGIAHDEMGSKRGALFFYRKCAACPNEVIRTVADEFARSITDEVTDKGIFEYPWLKRDHPSLASEIHRAESLHSDRCDARPARVVCGGCVESLLRVGDAEGQRQPRPNAITERQWENRQYKECCPYIEKTARLVEIARSCLNRAVVDAENAWLSRRSGKLLLALLGDLLLCKVPKKERVRIRNFLAEAAVTAGK
ncbi:hypothetical protein FOZ60_000828 [Perkinsus olseni]|uniref:Uncharacterized protein n=1 Tax=Perkinsus olseni TaxID=32597 RepID=A0A7J6PKC6_PEROL|nr:hypothetical protein FOZ60_000828 [Perkinsus olseni]